MASLLTISSLGLPKNQLVTTDAQWRDPVLALDEMVATTNDGLDGGQHLDARGSGPDQTDLLLEVD